MCVCVCVCVSVCVKSSLDPLKVHLFFCCYTTTLAASPPELKKAVAMTTHGLSIITCCSTFIMSYHYGINTTLSVYRQ